VLVEATNVPCFRRASPDYRILGIVLHASDKEAYDPWVRPALSAANMAASAGNPSLAFLNGSCAARLRTHMDEFAWEYRQQGVAFLSVARGRLELMKAELERAAAGESAADAPERRHPVVLRTLQYYSENLHDRITLTEAARAVGLSPNRLLAVFREVGLKPPMAYLRDMRMARANALLQDRNLRVKEIAATVGYPSLPAFTRTYRRVYGVPPGESRVTP
jgi:AraC-like DNA-binding protein